MRNLTLLQKIARTVSSSPLCARGRKLWEHNSKDWNHPLTKADKILCGAYLILHDFGEGVFPPRFEDQAEAYRNEIEYNASIPGLELEEVQDRHRAKPFWDPRSTAKHLGGFARALTIFQDHGVKPAQTLLELGCGSGWMAEMFAAAGYSVVGTTISPYDLEIANEKAAAHRLKKLRSNLEFRVCPMESLDTCPEFRGVFDAAYVYESLHHAFDWRKTLHATAATLKSRGWMLICHEPNRVHTFVSYRVAKLSHTHEIGFSKKQLLKELIAAGFPHVEVVSPRIDQWVSPLWLLARKR